ncbi:LysR family transcriptional regulator [Lacisediminihabitans profunda]|uniref:LysR family transcriptional regulator n=1 Tax=Lacisediminihabitans profunda TaxID=2594790 RepID=A0A5C8UM80_9MICO|nr:LysR family transcriptional regulator [Lacisediminihabitans profunda]TXN28931.1 LysR family transcriptional regulator [Lacisediminihabitans profunda]
MSFNLRQLECFFTVAETLHYGRAAERLFIAQSSVSAHVTQLEVELGERLFARTSRRVSLTTFGAEFLHELKPQYDALVVGYSKFQKVASGVRSLKLAHTPELGHWLFPNLLDLIDQLAVERRPAWRPRLMHTHDQIEGIVNGAVDLGLCWEASVPNGVENLVIARSPFVAVLRQDDPLAQKARLRLSDLRERHLLVSPRPNNSFLDAKLQKAMVQAGLTSSALEEVAGYDEIGIHVRTSRAVGVHPAPVASISRTPGVCFRLLAEDDLWVNVCVISAPRDNDEQRAEMIELLRVAAEAATEQNRLSLSETLS